MIPVDALYQWQPWRAENATVVPHNALVTDLLLENYVWKQFILQCLRERQLPLWNPYILSGQPFLANGQHSALYPFSLIFFIFPLTRAYGLFTVSQLLIAGLALYYYARTIRLSRLAAAAGGLLFAFSGFVLVNTVFPMILAAVAWLPFLLAIIEKLLQAVKVEGAPPLRERLRAPLPWLILGSLALGLQFLAGHAEFNYYNLLVLGAYAAWRASAEFVFSRRWRDLLGFAGLFVLFVLLGTALGAVQTIPFYEIATRNFREGSQPYEQIISYAFKPRQAIGFLIPDFFGNPTHHSYVDLFSHQTVTAWRNAHNEPTNTIFWGMKNYVEAGSYVALLGLFLAFIGAVRRPRAQAWFFIALGLFSLTLVFGLPTYALIFRLPGIRQLHSPYRWVFPYTVCIAVLAAMGVEALGEIASARKRPWLPTLLGLAAMGGAVAALGGIALALAFPSRVLPVADRLVRDLALAEYTFADGRMFLSYEARNLLFFALCLAGAGATLLGVRWLRSDRPRRRRVWALTLLAVLFLDPALWFHGLMPAADPAPLSLRPQAIEFLQRDKDPCRFTVFDLQSHKPLPPNLGMLFGLYDIRGYDSIIAKQYAEVMERLGPQELEYNQIARLTRWESLSSPILDLLNVRYVLTEEKLELPHYTLVYEGELRIYRNDDALPRAFVVFQARTVDRRSLLDALPEVDPRQAVLLEQEPQGWTPLATPPPAPPVEFVEMSPNQVQLRVDMPAPGFLVLADSYAPGWVAYTRADGQSDERALTILRAYGTLRAVQLPAGQQTVRFKYSPGSFKTGLFVSFLAAVCLFLLGALWVWLRLYTRDLDEHAGRRVARNTFAPLLLQLLNKAIDTVFAMLMLRLLGPDNAGKYYFAIIIAGWFEILTNFGLNTLLTREVARSRPEANRYLSNTTILRLVLAVLSAPLLILFLLAWRPMPQDTALAIILLAIGLVPSSISAGLSAVFMAFEVMEIPAAVTTLTTLLKVSFGAAALLAGWGFIGLAGTSVIVSLITLFVLLGLLSHLFFRPHLELEPKLQRQMVSEAYPLMINHLLATLFFKVDVTLLQRLWGDSVVGWYSTSYKFVDAVGIIPPTFTMAIFPLMSRLASSSRDTLYRTYILSIKLLFSLALLIALLATALAYPLMMILGGAAYLPHSAIALQFIVWYMPIGFINSVTQYVLIALDQQRFLTRAFAIGLAFNLGANLLLIPRFGYPAAAITHVFSELALLIPFYVGIRRYLAPIPWFKILWRPLVAGGAAGALFWLLRAQSRLWVVPLAAAVYVGLIFGLRTFDAWDLGALQQVVPSQRLWRWLQQRLPARVAERPQP